jgi:genome maintenance exonuclease 1
LNRWRESIGIEEANRITEFSGKRGSVMHDLIEQHLLGGDSRSFVPKTDFEEVGFGLFKKLLPKLRYIEPIGLETVLWSDVLGVAGRCDCIGLYNGKLSIIDYKTSRKGKSKADIINYWIQTTFYALAFEEQFGQKIEQLVILMAIEDGVSAVFVEPIRPEYVTNLINRIEQFYLEQDKKYV